MASPSNHQREAETDEIPRRHRSGEHSCRDHESRIIILEKGSDELRGIIKDHGERLHQGDMGFLDVRKDLQALAKAVNDAVQQMKENSSINWGHEVLRSLISWGVPVSIIVLVWALVGSGAIALKGQQ